MGPGLNRSVEQTVNEYQMIKSGEEIVAGVSGGADSVCLLFLLSELREKISFSLKAVHINHMIRGEAADQDEEFVKSLCKRLQIPLIARSVNVPLLAKERKMSEEEAGREARYKVFFEAAGENGGKIAVAHHREDNAETVLLNLIRGTGIRGLSGIRPVSFRNGFQIIRPLLFQSRKEIEAFLEEKQIPFCEDATNRDTDYSRNALRLNVLPELQKLNGKASFHISETAKALGEIEEFLEKETEKAFREAVVLCGGETRIFRNVLLEKDPAIQKRIVLKALAREAGLRKDLSSAHVDAVLNLTALQSGRSCDLPYGLTARRQYEEICITKKETVSHRKTAVILKSEISETGKTITLEDGNELEFKKIPVNNGNRKQLSKKNQYTKAFDYDKIKRLIMVGEKVPGDVISLKTGHKTLKKLFQDEKIPLNQREKLLVLKDEESVIWVVGSRISEDHKITDHTKTALVIKAGKGEVGREY